MTAAELPEPWPRRPLPVEGDVPGLHLTGPATAVLSLALRPVGAVHTILDKGTVSVDTGTGHGLRVVFELLAARPKARPARVAALDGPALFHSGPIIRSVTNGTTDVMGMLTLHGVTDLAVVRIGFSTRTQPGQLLVHARTVVSRDAHGIDVTHRRARRSLGLSVKALISPTSRD